MFQACSETQLSHKTDQTDTLSLLSLHPTGTQQPTQASTAPSANSLWQAVQEMQASERAQALKQSTAREQHAAAQRASEAAGVRTGAAQTGTGQQAGSQSIGGLQQGGTSGAAMPHRAQRSRRRAGRNATGMVVGGASLIGASSVNGTSSAIAQGGLQGGVQGGVQSQQQQCVSRSSTGGILSRMADQAGREQQQQGAGSAGRRERRSHTCLLKRELSSYPCISHVSIPHSLCSAYKQSTKRSSLHARTQVWLLQQRQDSKGKQTTIEMCQARKGNNCPLQPSHGCGLLSVWWA